MAPKAIIWVPGFSGGLSIDQTPEGLAKRIARSYGVKNLGIDYSVDGRDEKYGDNYPVKVYGISSATNANKSDIVDVWHFDWESLILDKTNHFSLGTKIILLLLILIDGVRRVSFSYFAAKKGLGAREQVQVAYSLILLLIVAISLGTVIATVIQAIGSTVSPQTTNSSAPMTVVPASTNTPSEPSPRSTTNAVLESGATNVTITNGPPQALSVSTIPHATAQNALTLATNLENIVSPPKPPTLSLSSPATYLSFLLWLASWWKFVPAMLLVLFGLSSDNVRRRMDQMSTEIVAAYLYLSWDWQGEIITGRLESLVAHLAAQGYSDIHIFGCSIGSIYSLNYLFPTRAIVSATRSRVDRLVTIGCPHDFITTYWNTYFRNRHAAPKPTFRWENVYCLTDVFGSNFKTSDIPPQNIGLTCPNAASPPLNTAPLRPNTDYLYAPPNYGEGVDFMNSFILLGFQAHSIYWGTIYEGEENCLDFVV